MEYGCQKYPGFFTHHSLSFMQQDTAHGKLCMHHAWQRMDRADWLQRHEGGVLGSSSKCNARPGGGARNKHGGLRKNLKSAMNVIGHMDCRNKGGRALD